ncbi:hypothetical protein [Mucilaginibacter sp.]|uniref:hypothetical protein n=1 Tax=Mucilaginibacter sp. TaxID=1882438 RepID=UPI00262720AA|nr:hypothetical protein [Mucilaginibacter sp.]MDB5127092.1 hypothetical protein [Mucilaginibacter sp.]
MVWFVITTLAIFFIASVFYQVKSLQGKFAKFDILHLLPNYSFFAPRPMVNDYRLVYKIIGSEEWLEVPLYKYFSLQRIFWNPFKYYNKGMIDCFNFLIAEFNNLAEDNKDFILISENYLNILMLIVDHIKDKEATIRFAIVAAEGVETIQITDVIFASAYQKL